MAYDFPGNVRELRALVYDAVAQHKSRMISMNSFRKVIERSQGRSDSTTDAVEPNDQGMPPCHMVQFPGKCPTLKESEMCMIYEALRRANNNQGIAATLLGISRQALNHRLARNFPTPS